jgi:hypothetical protein
MTFRNIKFRSKHWRTCFQYHYTAHPCFDSLVNGRVGRPFWVWCTQLDQTLSKAVLLLWVYLWRVFVSRFSKSVSLLRFEKLLSQRFSQILPAFVVKCCLYAFQNRQNSVDLFVCWTAERFSEAAAAKCSNQAFCFIKHSKQTIYVRRPNSFDMHSRCGHCPPTWEFSGWSFVALVTSVVDLRLVCCALLIDFI